MGLFDKFTEIMHENDEDDFDDFYDEEPSFKMPAPPRREKARNIKVPKEEKAEKVRRPHSNGSNDKVVNIHTTAQVQVVPFKPERFEDAPTIADNLNARRIVALNLETTNKEVSRRLLDFLSGVAYANNGLIKKISTHVYLITPYDVDFVGDILDELENNGVIY